MSGFLEGESGGGGGGSPTGPAGGNLGGTYPNPIVISINGVTVTGTPTAGEVLTATSSTAADWAPAASGFTAGHDLSGTSTSQTVIGIQGNPVMAGTLGAAQDGYVLTWVFADGQLEFKPSPSGTLYSHFFALMPGDNSATIAANAPIFFPQNGPSTGAATSLGAGLFNLPTIGTYEITWQASVTEAGQLQLAIGGVGLPDTVVGRATGTTQIVGFAVITTTVVNSVLSVINPAGNTPALTMTVSAGGTHSVSATLTIKFNVSGSGGVPGVPPTGPAFGDLSGNYPDPIVVGIQGITVSSTPPTTGQVLEYNGSQYVPTTPSGSGFTAGGDLSGTSTSQEVIGIEGKVLPALATGYLNYTGSAWQFSTLPSSLPPSGAAGGDLGGTYPNPTVLSVAHVTTGVLPTANQAAQTMAGAIGGTTAASTINLTGNASITGNLPVTNLAAGTTTQVLLMDGSTPTWTTLSGGATVSATGVVTLSSSSITLTGDVTGPANANTVVALQGNPVQSGTLGATQDGYVLTWTNGSTQWQARAPATLIADGLDYHFCNSANTISGYNELEENATQSQATLTASTSSSSKVLIKAFATDANEPGVEVLPAGDWIFNFYAYASLTGAFLTTIIFDVYTRTSGGAETLLFSVTSGNIQVTSVGYYTVTYSDPNNIVVPSTNVLVIKVSAQSANIIATTVSFVFDGTTNASYVETPLAGAAIQLGGDLSGTTSSATVVAIQGQTVTSGALVEGDLLIATSTSNWAPTVVTGDVNFSTSTPGLTTVLNIHGASVPIAGSLTTGNILQVTGVSALGYAPVNLAGGANYVTGALPNANQAAQNMSGAVGGNTAASTINLTGNASITGALPVSNVAPGTSGQILMSNGTPATTWTTLSGGATISATGVVTLAASSITLGGDVTGAASANTVGKIQGNTVTSGALTKGQFFVASSTSNWAATTLSGDISESGSTAGLLTVVGIDGTPIVLTSLTTGNLLQYNGTDWVNIAPPGATGTAGGDLSGSYPNPTVVQAQGGDIIFNTTSMEFAASVVNPSVYQNTTSAATTSSSLTIQAQNNTHVTSTGGNLVLSSGTGTTADGYVVLQSGSQTGANYLELAANGAVTIQSLGTGVVHSSSAGLLSSSLIVNADIAATGTANIAVNKLATGTSAQLLMSNATPTPTWTSMSGDVTISATGATTVGQLQGTIVLSGTPSSGQVLVATSSTAADWATSPATVTWADDLVNSTNTAQYVSALSYSSAAAGGAIGINGTGTSLVWASGNTGPLIDQTALASTSAASGANGVNFTLEAQAGQAATGASHNGGNGGNLVFQCAAGGTSGSATAGSAGFVNILNSTGATMWQMGALVGTPADGAIYSGAVTPSATNYSFGWLSSGTQTQINAATQIGISIGGSGTMFINSGSVAFYIPVGGHSGFNAFSWTSTTVALTSGSSNVLTSTQYANPHIKFTGTLTGAGTTITFPSTDGAIWNLDFSGVTFGGNSIALIANGVTWSGAANITSSAATQFPSIQYTAGAARLVGVFFTE